MPKVYITREQKLNNKLVTLIYGTMKVKRVTQSSIAKQLGISQQAFALKLKKCHFSFLDLFTIFEVLEIEDKEILSVMRERNGGV